MKVRLPLYAQIVGMLFLYLLTLAAIVFISLNAQFGFGCEALIKSPLGDRVNTIADAVAGRLASSKKAEWNDVLKSYEKRHHVKFYLFDIFGNQLAGPPIEVPKTIVQQVPEFGRPHRFGPWPPAMVRFRMHNDGARFFAGRNFDGPSPTASPNNGIPDKEKTTKATKDAGDAEGPVLTVVPSGGVAIVAPGSEKFLTPGFEHGMDMGPPPGHGMGLIPDDRMGPPPEIDGGPPPGRRTELPPKIAPGSMLQRSEGSPVPNVEFDLAPASVLEAPSEFAMHGRPFIHRAHDPLSPPDFGPPDGGPPTVIHVPPDMMHARGQFMLHSQNPDRFWIGTRVPVVALDAPFPIPCVLIAETDNIWRNNLLFDTALVLEAGAVVLAFSLIFWWPFVYSISHSLAKLTTATEAIADGRFDTRLTVKRGDEIGRLSEAVNIMAGRLANFVSGQKRFLGDISHELFSPLARLQMALELLDEDATENQKAMVNDIREEVSEMNNLVNELLAFSKAGLKGREIELTVVNVKGIVSEQLDRMNIAENIVLNISGDLRVVADAVLLSRAISNVLRNAVRYAGDKGPITITAERHSDQVSITISDRGNGVPEEALSRLAEPFFRPEASRSRSSGGVGLGLAIVKSCIEACNGTVIFRNRAQGGFEVEMRLQQA
ncbi:MAG TPA: HAMP domain-containing sensor histidine kinase [Oculatellaceae cyanobacterium]